MLVSNLAENLIGSEILKIAAQVNAMKAGGAQVSNLTVGDFDPSIFPIPEALQEEIAIAYAAKHTNYPPADGVMALRQSVSAFLKEHLGLSYSADKEIMIAGGSRPLIYSTYLAIVDPGDKIIFPTPSWNNNHYAYLTQANAVMLETKPEHNYMPSAADIAPHVKGAVLLALCSPLNPTGTMFSKQDLEEICDLVIAENKSRKEGEKPLYIMFDQMYWMLTFGDHKHYDPVSLRPELKDYVIYIDGSSKAFAATGVRVGWGFGPESVISKMKPIVGHMGAWAPKAEQVATSVFLQQKEEVATYMSNFKEKVQKSLSALHTGFQHLKNEGFDVDSIEPMGAIYLTVKVNMKGKTTPEGKVLSTASDVNFYLIKEAGMAFVPFSAFGTTEDEFWFRASIGAASLADIEAGIPRLKAALQKLS
ncbi:pyridoxal phosphate-dependent aminotransferase [Solitalea lacus]|uniref:pyridoxal phosphate-dependent aminotransferase n=1 Tax=Solitalea lacus TaxID=2911172 RepID=UPI001EDB5629|nr:aminotransferase class I/II-fold pyridoxal phosphate-dependent enzyme [Solitalea lacus]UKJ07479.1 aminotransferase class I/II-fold pyridoxal phosphate-dependent enzyme [Solitalea lacus]